MKSWRISDGDLVLRGGAFENVEGYNKVVQDLGLGLSEPLGNDRFHPDWGSLLDSYIGRQITAETSLLIRSEITRVVRNYMLRQRNHMARAKDLGIRNQLQGSEVVVGIKDIRLNVNRDTIRVRITITTGAQDPVVLTLTMEP